MTNNPIFEYLLCLADDALILGQRLGEWCGHGPVLEQDIALTNIALDLIGRASSQYKYAAELEGNGRTEDDLAFLRTEREYRNLLLLEQPNTDFAYTIARQFFYDAYSYPYYTALMDSSDKQLAAIAEKSIKEITYHLRFSSEWMIRLGDGTDVSHEKIQTAVNELWMYTGELFKMTALDTELLASGVGVDPESIHPAWTERIDTVLTTATLTKPEDGWMHTGGREGKHTEHLGFMLADMQFMQRAFPGVEW